MRSPLRYPGGKQRAIAKILALLPSDFSEFREPFVGGGSVFLAALERSPNRSFWINDLNPDLCYFWESVRDDLPALVRSVRQLRDRFQDGRALFLELSRVDVNALSPLERAARFFVLNRITFSGTIESGGYSQSAFETRFTLSSIQRLADLAGALSNVKITHGDYAELLRTPGDNVLIFLDPPYLSNAKSRLYGRQGDLHAGFDHQRFAQEMAACPHRWLITYDDCPQVRANFPFAHIHQWSLPYGMANLGRSPKPFGNELFLRNFL